MFDKFHQDLIYKLTCLAVVSFYLCFCIINTSVFGSRNGISLKLIQVIVYQINIGLNFNVK